MKRYITFSCFLVLLVFGMQTSFGQESSKASKEAMKQTILNNESAKDQTFALHKIVNLNADQISKINDMFLELDKSKKSAELSESGKTKSLVEIETMKTNKLKELLTEEQYGTYLKSIKKE